MPDYPRPTRIPKSLWEKLKPLVREKRREPIIAENHLWQCLRNRQLNGLSTLDTIKRRTASLQTASSPSLQSGEGAGG